MDGACEYFYVDCDDADAYTENWCDSATGCVNTPVECDEGKVSDPATAYFSISGYRLLADRLHKVGAFRLLIGSDPQTGSDVGLRPNDRKALSARLKGDLEAEPFTPETLRLVENLIAFLRADKVQVRLYDNGFLHAKCYLFHHDNIAPTPPDRPGRCGVE